MRCPRQRARLPRSPRRAEDIGRAPDASFRTRHRRSRLLACLPFRRSGCPAWRYWRDRPYGAYRPFGADRSGCDGAYGSHWPIRCNRPCRNGRNGSHRSNGRDGISRGNRPDRCHGSHRSHWCGGHRADWSYGFHRPEWSNWGNRSDRKWSHGCNGADRLCGRDWANRSDGRYWSWRDRSDRSHRSYGHWRDRSYGGHRFHGCNGSNRFGEWQR